MMESPDIIISLDSPVLGFGHVVLSNPHRIGIRRGCTVIYGENGSGKSTLGKILEKGRYARGNRIGFAPGTDSVRMISFTDIHALSGMETQYFAQRMESSSNDYVPDVSQIMGEKMKSPRWAQLCADLRLSDVGDKKINYLSSGELRKLLIVNALLCNPDVLILDNPYIGLDHDSRTELDATVRRLCADGISVVMLLCDPADIPEYTDSLIIMDNLSISVPVENPADIATFRARQLEYSFDKDSVPPPPRPERARHEVSFSIRRGHIRYGSREILRDVDWTVRSGERWVLTGPNGCGKSLLLSLVCADHPQAYANDIVLFDRKRGTGESIWQIKDSIGYVSPEMQLFFRSGSTVREIVMQGLRSALNRYQAPTAEELAEADRWLALMGISSVADRRFSEISTGEQRLVLVGRALIRQPELLILDEPLHGLDAARKRLVRDIIDTVATCNGSSLIFVTHYESEIPSCVTLRKTLIKLAAAD